MKLKDALPWLLPLLIAGAVSVVDAKVETVRGRTLVNETNITAMLKSIERIENKVDYLIKRLVK